MLVLEPGTGLKGKLKTARKGVGDYTVTVKGRASHAGVDFEAGASAIVELARQIERIAGFTASGARHHRESRRDLRRHAQQRGRRRGARRSRYPRCAHQGRARRWTRNSARCGPFDKRCSIQVEGGLNRPPMERTAAIRKLFQTARGFAKELGVKLEESLSGGGSDGNFTAALGVPTLDGLGGVGEGAHARTKAF